MINWFDMPAEGLSNGGLFEVKELEVTENGTYETKGEMYNKVTVNVEGGGGSSDFSTATVTFNNNAEAQFLLSIAFDKDGEPNSSGPLVEGIRGIAQAILYKGMAFGLILNEGVTVSTSGAAEYEDGVLIITGDCTITIS